MQTLFYDKFLLCEKALWRIQIKDYIRCNCYSNKVNPPACMVSDVMHLEINDSVFNNFVGRHFPYTLWDQGTFVLALVVGIVFLNVAAHRPSQVPPSVSWARAAGKAGVRSAKEPGDK